jgi:hypothetical protein
VFVTVKLVSISRQSMVRRVVDKMALRLFPVKLPLSFHRCSTLCLFIHHQHYAVYILIALLNQLHKLLYLLQLAIAKPFLGHRTVLRYTKIFTKSKTNLLSLKHQAVSQSWCVYIRSCTLIFQILATNINRLVVNNSSIKICTNLLNNNQRCLDVRDSTHIFSGESLVIESDGSRTVPLVPIVRRHMTDVHEPATGPHRVIVRSDGHDLCHWSSIVEEILTDVQQLCYWFPS